MAMRPYEKFHYELLELQRRMRLLRMRTPLGIDPAAAFVLPFVMARQGATVKDVADYLAMDSGNATRTIQRLGELEFIFLVPSPKDARSKLIQFTDLGGRVARQAIKFYQYLAEVGMYPLTPKEREKIGRCLKIISSSLGASEELPQYGEELFTVEQKRIGRVTGMAGSDYLSTGYDIGGFQILNTLYRLSVPERFSDFAERIPLERTVLSRRVEQQTKLGLIKKSNSPIDKRSVLLSLSKKGNEKFERLFESSSKRFSKGVSQLNQKELQEMFALFEQCRIVEEERTATEWIKILSDRADLFLVRAFILENLVERGDHKQLSPVIVSESAIAVVFIRNEKILAAGVFESERKSYHLAHLILDNSLKSLPPIFRNALETKASELKTSLRLPS
jgi:DNA-binding MarR family transcriptional regulator